MTISLSYKAVVAVTVCFLAMPAAYGASVHSKASTKDASPPSQASKKTVLEILSHIPPVRQTSRGSVVAEAAAKVQPAVVTVHTLVKSTQIQGFPFGGGILPNSGDPGAPSQEVPSGAGSGVLISADGYVLTNNHVIEDTDKVTVEVNDKGYDAKVVGTDPATDIAVVKIDTKGAKLPFADLGDSDDVRIGDWAIAIGNPLDIGTTVTLGIISAINRPGPSRDGRAGNPVLQTDAAINPGNSGGALANIDGQVIGINEAIVSPTGSYVGIGFAIPINAAKKIAAELIQNGRIIRPYLGIRFMDLKRLPQDARASIGITVTGDEGVIVAEVFPDSPSEKAGVQVYDTIREANHHKITDIKSMYDIIQTLKVGDVITLLISRNGNNQIVPVTVGERPANYGLIRNH